MGRMSVHLYRANNNEQKWIDRAMKALSDMEGQLNFSIYTYDEGDVSVNIGGTARDMLDNWENYIENHNITIDKYDVQLLIVNTLKLGAGALRGGAVGPKGATPIANSEGTAGFANASVRFNNECYGGQQTFPPTVIHEVGHAALTRDLTLPENNNEHSAGAVHQDKYDSVSPMQLWYTGDPCSGNSPPSDNCNNRPTEYSEGVTNDLSSCTSSKMNEYLDSF